MSNLFSNGQSVLVISNSKALPILSHIKSQIGCSGSLEVIPTSELSQPSLRFKSEHFDVVMDPGLNFHDDTILFEFSRILKPGGIIFFQEPILTKAVKLGPLRTKSEFESALLISGLEIEKFGELKSNTYDNIAFVEQLAKQLSVPQENILQALQTQSLSFVEYSTKKPQIHLGSSHSISFSNSSSQLPKKTKLQHEAPPQPNSGAQKKDVWKLSLEDMEDEELEFIEEEKLLLKEDLNKDKIVSFDPNNDCGTGTGKLKACKNCTCGRAELAESENQAPVKKITLEDLEKGIDLPESSCGSCYLGDAFRCPTCPMLGLPSFKPNQKVKLNPN